jgi:hypothetical protein
MQKDFSTAELDGWKSNFNNSGSMPFVTESGLITLDDLEKFIATAKEQQADSVRIYFLRFSLDDAPTAKIEIAGKLAEGCKWFEAASGLTQATVALVPTKNFKLDENFIFSADDIVVGSAVTTLMPGIEGKGTGLNPPKPR